MERFFCYPKIIIILLLGIFILHSPLLTAQKNKKKKNEEKSVIISDNNNDATSEAEYYFVEGMKFYIIDDYPKALEQFQRALALSSGNATINFKIAETYFKKDNLDQAEFYAVEALEKDKTNKYFYLLLAKIYEKKQKLDEAIKTYKLMIDNKVGSEEFYYEIAQICLKQQNYDKALEAFNKLEKAYGVSESVIYQKQKIFIQLKQLDKAIAEGEKLIQANPLEAKHLITQAELLIANGKSKEALPTLEQAAQNQSLDPRLYLLLAKIYRSEGNKEKATEQLKKAFANPELDANDKVNQIIDFMRDSETTTQQNDFFELAQIITKVHPENAKAHSLQADLFLLKNDKDAALESYLKAVKADRNKADLWQRILALDAEANKIDSLIRHSDQALEYFPNQALFWMYNGMGYLGKHNFEKAVLAFEEGKRLALNNQELLNDFNLRLGDAYNGLKQYAESDAAYEAVLKNTPNNEFALNNYSYYLALRKEKLDLAKQLAERLTEKNPENPTYMDTFGWVLYSAKDYKKAKKYLEKAALKATNGTVLEHYGDVLFKLGEPDKALEQWSKAKKMGGASGLIDKKIANKNLYE